VNFRPPKGTHEKGATMVEFSMISMLLFAIVTGVFDVAIVMRDQSMLTNVTQQEARSIATSRYARTGPVSCSARIPTQDDIALSLRNRFDVRAGVSRSDIAIDTVDVEFAETLGGAFRPEVVLRASMATRGILTSFVSPVISSTTRVPIEDPDFTCIED